MTQWRDRILEFLPDAKIGKIQQDTIDIEGKDIVLAMVQSLSIRIKMEHLIHLVSNI